MQSTVKQVLVVALGAVLGVMLTKQAEKFGIL